MQTPEAEIQSWTAQPWEEQAAWNLGLRPVTQGGSLFCACATQAAFAIDGVRHQWPKGSTVRWHIGMPRLGALTDLDMKEAHGKSCAEIMGYCSALKLEYAPNPKTANVIWEGKVIDGTGMILAMNEIPFGPSQPDRVLHGWFDTGDVWTISRTAVQGMIDWARTAYHEFLHALGYGHGETIKSNPALLEPTYSWNLWTMQPRDIEELQIRYDRPIAAPANPPTNESESYSLNFSYPNLSGKIVITPNAAACGAELLIKRGNKQVPLAGTKAWQAAITE